MIDIGIIITGVIGIFTTITGSWVSFIFTRKKYNSEVNSNEITNLQESLKFYKTIVDDNNERLQFYIKLTESNRLEIYRLKEVIHILLENVCIDKTCLTRKYFNREEVDLLLSGIHNIDVNKLNKNETEVREETL